MVEGKQTSPDKPKKHNVFLNRQENWQSSKIAKSYSHTSEIFHVEEKQPERPKKPKFELMEFQKQRLKIAGIIACILAAVGLFYLAFQPRIAALFAQTRLEAYNARQDEVSRIVNSYDAAATAALDSSGVYSLIRFYDELIQKETSPDVSAAFYLKRASVLEAYQLVHPELALSDYIINDLLAAEQTYPSELTANALYQYYLDREDTTADYYRGIYLERLAQPIGETK